MIEVDSSMVIKGFLCMIRLAIVIFVAPFFGGNAVSGMARNVIIFGIALFIFPTTWPQVAPLELSVAGTIGLFTKEVFLGVILGFMLGFVMWALIAAGMYIDLQRGEFLNRQFDPYIREGFGNFARLFRLLVIALLVSSGLFMLLIEVAYESYVHWPINSYYPSLNSFDMHFFVKQSSRFMYLVLGFAAPFMLVFFLIDFSLGMINRFAPQLEVFFLGLPVKSLVGIIFFFFYVKLLGKRVLSLYTEQIGIIERVFAG